MASWKGLIRRIKNYSLQLTLREILDTPPIQSNPQANVVLVSQLHPRDVNAYLLAIKSVMQTVNDAAVIVVDDGLSFHDRQVISTHITGVNFIPIKSVNLHRLQSGGTWERLLTLVDQSQTRYAMQIDSDILATAKLPELLVHINAGRSYALTNKNTTGVDTFTNVSAWILQFEGPHIGHVQKATELLVKDLEDPDERKYIKATSAFTGFAVGSASIADLQRFSGEVGSHLGDLWSAWGSEQVASNYMIANAPKTGSLPWPDYINNSPEEDPTKARLIHFYGTHRFDKGHYRRMAKDVIKRLKNDSF